jgi:hypothetical protein
MRLSGLFSCRCLANHFFLSFFTRAAEEKVEGNPREMPRPKKHKADPSAQLLTEKPLTPAQKKTLLLDNSDSDSEGQEYHSAVEAPEGEEFKLKINEEYARRFEHNKKREELHRCIFLLFDCRCHC